MRFVTFLGIFLIVAGVLAFGYQGVIWVSGTEQVAKVGPVEVNRQKDVPVPIAPLAGGAALVAGIILLASGVAGNKSSVS